MNFGQYVCQMLVRCGWKHQNISSKFCLFESALNLQCLVRRISWSPVIRLVMDISMFRLHRHWTRLPVLHCSRPRWIKSRDIFRTTSRELREVSVSLRVTAAGCRTSNTFFLSALWLSDHLITKLFMSSSCRRRKWSSTLSQPCEHADVAPTLWARPPHPQTSLNLFFFFFYMKLLHCQTSTVSGDRRYKQIESGVELFLCKVFFFFLCQQKTK